MTYHSIERAAQRGCLSSGAAADFIGKAEKRGLGAEDLPARERKFMEKLTRTDSYPVYYGGYLFILGKDGNGCITMYAAPDWFFRTNGRGRDHGIYIGKTYVRNPKKYRRHYPESDPEELCA